MSAEPTGQAPDTEQFRRWMERKGYSWPDDVGRQRDMLDEYLLDAFSQAEEIPRQQHSEKSAGQ